MGFKLNESIDLDEAEYLAEYQKDPKLFIYTNSSSLTSQPNLKIKISKLLIFKVSRGQFVDFLLLGVDFFLLGVAW
jgi:hypothetical protein